MWSKNIKKEDIKYEMKWNETKRWKIINIKSKESKLTIPSDINGLLKSMTRCRSEVIVIGAMAISASCNKKNKKIKENK